MHSILNPFRYPVPSKGNENNQTNHFGGRTATCAATSCAGWICTPIVRFVFNVYRHQRNGEPSAKSQCSESTDCTDEEDMAEALGNIHCGLEHHDAERDPGYPAHKTYDTEDPKYDEYNCSRIVMSVEVIDGGAKGEYDLQYPRDPLRPVSFKPRKLERRYIQ